MYPRIKPVAATATHDGGALDANLGNTTSADTQRLPVALASFLDQHADALDADTSVADALLPAIGHSGLLRCGVPEALGGDGQALFAGVEAIAAVAQRSLAAAFVFWSQRAFIEYLVQSDNHRLRDERLPALLAGRQAGATGLSNAMKHLSGLEPLGLVATGQPGQAHWRLNGRVPWSTNLRPAGFQVAVAVDRADGGPPFIAALPHDRAGVRRSADLDLIALRGSHTAALAVDEAALAPTDLISDDARRWLPQVRPAFLGLQCGMAIGLTRAALAAARAHAGKALVVLGEPISAAEQRLAQVVQALQQGLADGRFVSAPVPLFQLRLALSDLALQAVQLELQASGGRAYHRDQGLGFARRWREAAFIPIVTPSVAQLQGALQKHHNQQRGQDTNRDSAPAAGALAAASAPPSPAA